MIYGYARISTDGQSLTAQVTALRKHGASKVFREVASGAKTDRAQLRRLLEQLEAGDVVTVTRLDRLARSTRDPLNTLAAINRQESRVQIPWRYMDRHRDGARTAYAYCARGGWRSSSVRARTGEGRARAVARGQRMGRPPKLTPHQQKREAIKRREQGETLADIARTYNVSPATIYG